MWKRKFHLQDQVYKLSSQSVIGITKYKKVKSTKRTVDVEMQTKIF